jgi:hypothetical protein
MGNVPPNFPPACQAGSCHTKIVKNEDEVNDMKLFNAKNDNTGEVLCIAARDMDHASAVYVTFWIARSGNAPGAFSIGRGAPAEFQDSFTAKTVERGDVAGVIVQQLDGSMLFEAASA